MIPHSPLGGHTCLSTHFSGCQALAWHCWPTWPRLPGPFLGGIPGSPPYFFWRMLHLWVWIAQSVFCCCISLSLYIHQYEANSKMQLTPDPQWLLRVVNQTCRIPSLLIAQGHWPRPWASSLLVGPAYCIPQSSPVKPVKICLSHLPLLVCYCMPRQLSGQWPWLR